MLFLSRVLSKESAFQKNLEDTHLCCNNHYGKHKVDNKNDTVIQQPISQ